MKNQVIFFSKDKSKKLKCRLLQFLFGALRVKEKTNQFGLVGFWFNSPLRQYFSLYRAVSKREGERGKKG